MILVVFCFWKVDEQFPILVGVFCPEDSVSHTHRHTPWWMHRRHIKVAWLRQRAGRHLVGSSFMMSRAWERDWLSRTGASIGINLFDGAFIPTESKGLEVLIYFFRSFLFHSSSFKSIQSIQQNSHFPYIFLKGRRAYFSDGCGRTGRPINGSYTQSYCGWLVKSFWLDVVQSTCVSSTQVCYLKWRVGSILPLAEFIYTTSAAAPPDAVDLFNLKKMLMAGQ